MFVRAVLQVVSLVKAHMRMRLLAFFHRSSRSADQDIEPFDAVGARWTPKAALIMDRDQHLAAMQKPWPVGCHRMGTAAAVSA